MSEALILPLTIRSRDSKFWDISIYFTNLDALKRCVKTMLEKDLEIIDMHLTRSYDRGGAYILVDASYSKVDVNLLNELIRDVDGIQEINIAEIPVKGVGVHYLLYPMQLGPFRVTLIPDKIFSTLINEIKEKWGSAGEYSLYEIGRLVGESLYKTTTSVFRTSGMELLEIISLLFRTFGWASKTHIIEYDLEKGIITTRIYDNIECRYIKTNKPNSQFIRGVITGIIGKMLKRKTQTIEEKCIAKGDPYCQFKTKTQ